MSRSDLPVLGSHQHFAQGPQQSLSPFCMGCPISLCLVCLIGLLEGFKVEKVDLQEALGKKEESEQQLILELEGLRKQLQQAARELLTQKEEKSVLWNQKETLTNEAKEREAGEKCDWQEAEWDGGNAAAGPRLHERTWSFQRQKCREFPLCGLDAWAGCSIQLLCSGPEGVCLHG